MALRVQSPHGEPGHLTVVSPPQSSTLLAVETVNLSKRYGEMAAVESLNLRVNQGEVFGFLGPNGAGKTTTLRMLLGLIAPTSGTISLLGAPPGTPESLAMIGAMIETPSFYPFLSGRDNLGLLAAYTGTHPRRIEDVLDQVDLASRGDDPFRTYSLGMKQRLGVAAALLTNPPLLILDEPTNGLDPAGMADMRQLIRRLGHDGHTVVLSSHLMNEVEQVCDRVGIIAGGRIVAEGAIRDLRGSEVLLVRVDQPELARTLLTTTVPGLTVREEAEGNLTLDVKDGYPLDAAGINCLLVNGHVAVSEIRLHRPSLEQVFLNLTGEHSHA